VLEKGVKDEYGAKKCTHVNECKNDTVSTIPEIRGRGMMERIHA
jgi:hypothetical protein